GLRAPRSVAEPHIGSMLARRPGAMPSLDVSDDRGLYPLVDDEAGVAVVYPAKGVREAEVVTQEPLHERYGVRTGAAYADMAVLRGDASDGLPGVPGIGEKTAAALIRQFGSLEGLQQALADGAPGITGARRANLLAAADYLRVAPGVVRVARDADVPAVPLEVPTELADPETLQQLVEAYGIGNPVARLMKALGLEG